MGRNKLTADRNHMRRGPRRECRGRSCSSLRSRPGIFLGGTHQSQGKSRDRDSLPYFYGFSITVIPMLNTPIFRLPEIKENQGTLGNEITLVCVVLGCLMWETNRPNWPPSKDFFDNSTNIGKPLAISKGGKTATSYNLVDLGLCAFHDIGIETHSEDEHGESCCGLTKSYQRNSPIWK